MTKETISSGILIMIPDKNGKWYYQYIFPDSTGKTWRFVKT